MSWRKLALSLAALGALLTGGALFTHSRASAREAAAEAAYPPAGQFVEVDGVRLHVLVQGAGPDLVLIHGASGSLRDFTFSLIPALTDRYRVIAVDRPGLGWSESADGAAALAVQARLIAGAARAVGAGRPIVLGQSYGGAVALSWAVEQPDALAALVLVSAPSHPWQGALPAFYKLTAHPLGQALAVPLLTAFVPAAKVQREVEAVFAPQCAPGGYAAHFGPAMTLRRKVLRANARQRKALLAEITVLQPRYDALSLPIEQVHGTADTTVGLAIHAARLERQVASARLTRLPGIGHMPHHTAAPEVLAAIDRAATRAGLR